MNITKISIPIRALSIASLGIVFYLLMLFTPKASDDLIYHLIWGTQQPIESVRDVFISLYHHYFQNNGRFVPHFFVQLFDGILGKSYFNIANTAVFLVFVLLLLRLDNKTEWRLLPVVLALILLLIPGFNNVFLWESGACNYLWTAVLLLVFYRLLTLNSINPRYSPCLFLFGILCGWTHEGLIIGFITGCLCYYTVHRNELTLPRIALLAGLIIGTLFLLLAPGSIHRFFHGKEGLGSIHDFVHQFISSILGMQNLRLFPLLLLFLLLLFIFKKIPNCYFHDNLLWLVATGVSFAFVLLTGHDAARSRFGIELYSLILIILLLDHFTINRSILVISALIVGLVLAQTLYYSYQNYQENKRIITQIQNSETGIIETNDITCPPLFDRLILRIKYSANRDSRVENYYGKEKLLFLPHRFMEQIRNEEKAFEEFETKTDLPFYAKRLNTESVNSAVFHLSDPKPGSIPFVFRPFADKMERYSAKEVKTTNLTEISLPEGRFVLVMKNHMIADRVKNITLQ